MKGEEMAMELFSIFETLSETRKKAAYLAVYGRENVKYFFNKKEYSLTYEEACQLIPEYIKESIKDIKIMEEILAAKKAEHKKLSALFIDNEVCTTSFFKEESTNNQTKE